MFPRNELEVMLRLRLLGTPDIEGRQHSADSSILSKPKRFALLAYLAAASPRGFHRRDTLLALFWPDFDQRRARAALNRTLYELRNEIDAGTIISHGNDELGVDREKVWCDVVAFEAALAAGDLLGALDLYRGDLLRGFFISGAPEFEHWQERESARLRELAARAALKLSGTMGDGPRWARRAREIDPNNERVLQNLLTVLDTAGDRAAALKEYESFARQLADDFGAEPAPETRALIECIRSRAAGPPPPPGEISANDMVRGVEASESVGLEQAAGSHGSSETEPAPPQGTGPVSPPEKGPPPYHAGDTKQGRAPVSTARLLIRMARRQLSGRHRLILRLSALALAVIAGVPVLRHFSTAPPPPPDGTVAVMPFEYRGDPSFAYLGEGVASLLAAALTKLPGIQSVDPRIVLASMGQAGGRPLGPRDGQELAGRLDAGFFVMGDIIEAGGRLRLNAALYGSNGTRKPLATANVEGAPNDIFALVDEAALALFKEVADVAGPASTAAAATRSLSALEAYVTGERALRLGRFGEAQDHFKRAVRADTTFALAALRLSQAANWTGDDWLAHTAADAAVRHGDHLTARQRLFANAWRAYINGAAAIAERGYRSLLATDSLNADAWFYLGETLYHWGPTYGWPAMDAAHAFSHALDLDPGNIAAIVHLGRLAATGGDVERLHMLTARLQRLAPTSDHTLELRALRAWATADNTEQRHVLAEMRTVAHPMLWQIAISVAVHTGDPGAALAFLPLLRPAPTLTSGDPSGHVQVRIFAAILEAARGRFTAANAWLDSVAVIDAARALDYRGALAIQPYGILDRTARDALRAEIEDFRSPDAERPTMPLNRAVRPTLFGILAARAGDGAALERALVALGEPTRRELGTQLYAHGLRASTLLHAEAARAARDPETMHQALLNYPISTDSTLPIYDVDYAEAHLRWLRAETFEATGNDETALRWYGTFPDPAGNDLVYLAPSHLHRARIHDRRGDAALAARHYARVIALWNDADAPLQVLVSEARQALMRLGREGDALPR